MRIFCAALLAGLAVLGFVSPADAKDPTRATKVCRAFSEIDIDRLSQDSPAPGEDNWSETWRRWAQDSSQKPWRGATPAVWFRLSSSEGMTPTAAYREVFGRRDGTRWTLYARQQGPGRVMSITPWRRTVVSATSASRLSNLIDQPCLWTAPPYLYSGMPLRDGRTALNPDGPLTIFEINAGDQHWRGIHASWILGEPGELRAIVFKEAFGLPEYLDTSALEHAFTPTER